MRSKWIVSEVPSVEKINTMSETLGISRLLAVILCVRGYDTKNASNFITKDSACIHDPYLLKDMDKAVVRIKKALENNEIITVYGDYDADGVTSAEYILILFALRAVSSSPSFRYTFTVS